MIFYYIRHGDPIYDPDSLTPLGHRQAEAVAKRLSTFGIDEVYSSTSNRAILTAMPTCEMNRIEKPTLLDFANEIHCWRDMTIDNGKGGRSWIFLVQSALEMLASEEVLALGMKWYEHPYFAGYTYKEGLERITRESDAFFASLGYEHIPGTGKYKVINHTSRRIALFAHQGFGIAFLSCLLNIPYSVFASHFDIGHSGMTVINFPNRDGISVPKVMTLASDSHLYREGLPTLYNYDKRF